jgi:glutamate synthase domain-containing protein 3
MASAQEEERAGTHPSTKVVDDKNDRKKKDQEDKKQDVKKEKRKDDVKKDVKKDNTKKEKPKKEGKVPQARGTVKTKSASTCGQDIGAMMEIHQKDMSGVLEERKVTKKNLKTVMSGFGLSKAPLRRHR